MGESFYEVLGVARDASQEAIAEAYRERVKETHPDLNDSPDASDEFQRVQAAEEVLGDPDERARYDRLGHASYATHFGDGSSADGGRWDVGSDPVADDAGDDDGDARGRWTGGGGSAAADATGRDGTGFGVDPNEYDRTRSGDGNPSQRSYDVGDDGASTDASVDGGASSTAGTGAAGGVGTARGGRASATGTAGSRAAGNASWQEQARRTEREWSKATQRDARNDDGADGYAVDDWTDTDVDGAIFDVRLTGSELVVAGITLLLYPFMAFSAVTPQFSLLVNVVVAVCALALTGYLLTIPRVGFVVFGTWTVLAPTFFLLLPALDPVSILGVVVFGAAWIPFGYSLLFLRVLR